ncbi:amino acid ABC transporter permease protein [Arthrobacter globiformis NBRC 12137]|uniref:Amino acid ABC transporter permease protein n=1 Tax=Arthrobacter globiformis (strain ATCC 8010 / DSM 20124 / JCM 1332 / NBRC 12137 / NCIMB 8907 / NRRL B-2979 / 168) TaxID=1077972 RepID=H0QK04_ARTG1|nr:amino acid ABC transporter permease [Arthrobacter globiformis]GAB13244.1 amino acid ABC transporter permease protein [Arthrobacter globiformis NBRC 12137]
MNFDFSIFWNALTSLNYVNGAVLAILLAVLAMALGIVLGFLIALARISGKRWLVTLSSVYVGVFRGLPTLLILLLAWNAAPQLIPALRSDAYSPFVAALISLTLVQAAYMAEIIRSALLSVDAGQPLAARALGLTPVQTMIRVVIPQAIRIAIPPTGSELINTIKYTSLASVISLRELLTTAQSGVSTTFRYAEFYAAAAIYYLAIVTIVTVVQAQLERKLLWTSKDVPSAPRPEPGTVTLDLKGTKA